MGTVQYFDKTLELGKRKKVQLEIGYHGTFGREAIYICIDGQHLGIDLETSDEIVLALDSILSRLDSSR